MKITRFVMGNPIEIELTNDEVTEIMNAYPQTPMEFLVNYAKKNGYECDCEAARQVMKPFEDILDDFNTTHFERAKRTFEVEYEFRKSIVFRGKMKVEAANEEEAIYAAEDSWDSCIDPANELDCESDPDTLEFDNFECTPHCID